MSHSMISALLLLLVIPYLAVEYTDRLTRRVEKEIRTIMGLQAALVFYTLTRQSMPWTAWRQAKDWQRILRLPSLERAEFAQEIFNQWYESGLRKTVEALLKDGVDMARAQRIARDRVLKVVDEYSQLHA